MKEVTTTKYECSDGTRFESKSRARMHEFKLVAEKAIGEDHKVTVQALIASMFDEPDQFISILTEVKAEKLRVEAQTPGKDAGEA